MTIMNHIEHIRNRYHLLQHDQPNIRARNAAEEIGVSECKLLATRIGIDATRLNDSSEAILCDVESLGEVMALTRNAFCVHERKGVYHSPQFFGKGEIRHGLFSNPDIDLRLFMSHWKFNFAAVEQTKIGLRKSLQFFDKEGHALHKIYATKKTNEAAYDALVKKFMREDQSPELQTKVYEVSKKDQSDDAIDWPGFRNAWENLKDTHDFFPMLKKFRVGREQGLRGIGSDLAYEVDNASARKVLNLVREYECDIMVFVGNRGCIQIHTGPVKKLVEHGPWYNVLDPKFNLHLLENKIARTWVTKKPTVDGIITALEVFDSLGNLIVTFFGKRKPGIPELDLWRKIISVIPIQ